MKIQTIRIYQHSQPQGYRILMDRLWPRGISKIQAHLDYWAKDLAPSPALRRWFNHDPEKFETFQIRYQSELQQNPAQKAFVDLVQQQLTQQDVLLLYAAKDTQHNQALVLQHFLQAALI